MMIFSNDLARDYIESKGKALQFFNADFLDRSAYKAIAKKVKRPLDPVIRDIFQEQLVSLPAEHASRRYLDDISKPCTMIVTGQQAGLYGGPLYTIYKALTTIKLAKQLSKEWNEAVIPVFFIASEDHDYNEVKCAGMIDGENQFQALCLPDLPNNRKPIADLDLFQAVDELTSRIDEILPDTEYKQVILERVSDCYPSGKGMSVAFKDWLLYLFTELGLLILDGADQRLKPIASQLLLTELENRSSLNALADTNKELEAAGYSIQLPYQENRPALFYLFNGERHSIEWDVDTNNYINLGTQERLSVDNLRDANKLSPKAALRPLMQDTLLPTVAYVGGPGEISYWAQLKRLYEAMGVTMPIVVPRASATLVEPKIKRHLQRYEIDIEKVIENPDQIISKVTNDMIPGHIKDKFEEIKKQLDNFWNELLQDVKDIEPTMQAVIEKGEKGVIKQVDSVEGRLTKAIQHREQTVVHQLQAILTHIMPEGNLQERKIGILPFLIKFGPALIQRLYDELEFPFTEHKIIEL